MLPRFAKRSETVHIPDIFIQALFAILIDALPIQVLKRVVMQYGGTVRILRFQTLFADYSKISMTHHVYSLSVYPQIALLKYKKEGLHHSLVWMKRREHTMRHSAMT